jgi:hypothetical protein
MRGTTDRSVVRLPYCFVKVSLVTDSCIYINTVSGDELSAVLCAGHDVIADGSPCT